MSQQFIDSIDAVYILGSVLAAPGSAEGQRPQGKNRNTTKPDTRGGPEGASDTNTVMNHG